ncbi:MAG TPA: hypothetical protein VKU39_00560 [Streptosporangiaceae bacterium]|nr:hypothetical protein [Streptosporangiaceae bacterium]
MVTIVAPAGAASAAPASHAPAASKVITVRMTGVPRSQVRGLWIRPDGAGPVYSLNCGTAQLIVNGSNARYNLKLHSILGVITQGAVVYTTDGIGNVPWPSGINLGSTYSNNLGTIPIPGIFVHNAYASGQIYTSQGYVCFYVVNAPW